MKQFKFSFDYTSKVKLYRQLFNIFVELIESGELAEGEKIPSVRIFAAENNISRNTVTHAYKDLSDAGYLYSQEKSGFYVKLPSSAVPVPTQKFAVDNESDPNEDDSVPTVDSIIKENKGFVEKNDLLEASEENIKEMELAEKQNTYILSDLLSVTSDNGEDINSLKSAPITVPKVEKTIVMPNGEVINNNLKKSIILSSTPEEALFESYSQALHEKSEILLKESAPFGDETLKIAIAAFLYKFHKLDVNPSQIIIGANIEQLFYNVLKLPSIQHPHKTMEGVGLLKLAQNVSSAEQIHPSIAVTETTSPRMKQLFKSAGIDIKELPMTEFGMSTDYLSTSGSTIAFFSSADYPEETDLTLSDPEEYSNELYEWISMFDYRYIFEFDTSTIPQMENLRLRSFKSIEQVIYFCSFRHLISNCINTGFIILPKKLINEYKSIYEPIGCQVSKLEQVALTDLIISGKLLNYLESLESLE